MPLAPNAVDILGLLYFNDIPGYGRKREDSMVFRLPYAIFVTLRRRATSANKRFLQQAN